MIRLFDATDFAPRSSCGAGWTDSLVVSSQAADLVIAAAYVSIPVSLVVLWGKRRGLTEHSWVILLFVAFIFLCGMTHVGQALMFHWPAYRLLNLVSWLAALVSAGSAVMIPVVVHRILGTKALNDVLKETLARKATLRERLLTLESENASLRAISEADRLRIRELEKASKLSQSIAQAEVKEKFDSAAAIVESLAEKSGVIVKRDDDEAL